MQATVKPTKSGTEILTVIADRVRNTSETFSVFTAHEPDVLFSSLTCKIFAGPVQAGQRWCVCGSHEEHARWGMQFSAQFATLAAPTTPRELELFFSSGTVDGWTMRDAYRLVDQLGDAAIQVIEEEPYKLIDAGITEEQLASLQAAWQRGKGLAPLYAQLSEWGIAGKLSDKLVKRYGFSTVAELTDNPYTPILDVNGYGWKNAESIARQLDLDARDPRRVAAGLAVAVHVETWEGGHIWVTQPAALSAATALLELPRTEVEQIVSHAIDSDDLTQVEDRIYPSALYAAERAIAASIAQRLDRAPLVDADQVEQLTAPDGLSDEQWSAVQMALTNTVSLLTGGPGCGKTTCIKSLIAAARELRIPVTLMAPTGKAAMRMREATGFPATTIHKRLGISPGALDSDVEIEPVTGLVVIDECSMLDTSVASIVLTRIGLAAHILLVGDPDQLPSVGPGAVLRDLIAADVLTRVHLTRVFRNDAGIAVNAARIRAGESLISLADCRIISAQTPEAAQQQVLSLLQREIPSRGWTADDCLVLCPTNDGASGRHTLNTQLQVLLNGHTAGQGILRTQDGRQSEIRTGDKVIVTKNQSDLGVFNGETGRVIGVNVPRSITVQLEDRTVTFAGEDKRILDLAYSITGHKAQGSEAPVVIIPVFYSRVLSREWLYTVITRARKQVYLIGDPSAMQACIRQVRINDRRTSLVDAITDSVGESAPAQRMRHPFAWNGESDVYHTRRYAAWWKTSCGLNTQEESWIDPLYVGDLRPCKRCRASSGAVVQPFIDVQEIVAEAV